MNYKKTKKNHIICSEMISLLSSDVVDKHEKACVNVREQGPMSIVLLRMHHIHHSLKLFCVQYTRYLVVLF